MEPTVKTPVDEVVFFCALRLSFSAGCRYKNMMYRTKGVIGAIVLGAIGISILWKGITGNISGSTIGEPIFPRSAYIITGLLFLILPITFLIVILTN
jgi:hypothetical protein